MTYSYDILREDEADEAVAIYEWMEAEGTLEACEPEGDILTADEWVRRRVFAWGSCLVRGYIDGELAGVMLVHAWSRRGACAEVGVAAFRKYFAYGVPLSLGAFDWLFKNHRCKSLVARVPVTNRHILRMCGACGFTDLGVLPGLFYSDRKGKIIDGHLLLATPDTVARAMEEAGL